VKADWRPFSMTLTVLWDGERIGRLEVTRRHSHMRHCFFGNFHPDPGCAGRAPQFAEAQRWLDAYAATKIPSEWDRAAERYEELSQEITRHVTFLELPAGVIKHVHVENGQMHVSAKEIDLVDYAYRHPPRCIKDLNPVPLEDSVAGLKRYDYVAYFRVRCPCAEPNAYLLGHFWEGEGRTPAKIFVSPLAVECPSCGRVSELIDTRQHGWDGEQGCDCNKTGEGPRVRFPCPQCGDAPLAVIPGFSYQGHEYDPLNLRTRQQDMFGWFLLYARCSRCGNLWSVTDFETA
jgi:hypothetical protein